MTTYLDKTYKAVVLPVVGEPKMLHTSLRELLKTAGFEWLEIVRTQYGHDNNFVMLVDDDAKQARKPYNSRAQYLSGYPLTSPILGGAIFLSEVMGNDGADLVDLSHNGLAYIKDAVKWAPDGGYMQWRQAVAEFIDFYEIRYPLPSGMRVNETVGQYARRITGADKPMGDPPTTEVDWNEKDLKPKCQGHAGEDAELTINSNRGETTYCDGSCQTNPININEG